MEENKLFGNNLFGAVEETKEERPKVTKAVETVVKTESNDTEEVLEVVEGVVVDGPTDFIEAAELIEESIEAKFETVNVSEDEVDEEDPVDIDLSQLMEIDDNQIIVVQDAKIQFKDFDKLLETTDNYLKQFENFNVTEANIKPSKKVRATLNKNKKGLMKLRTAVKKQLLIPFGTIDDQVNQVIDKIDAVNNTVDSQIKDIELKDQEKKGLKIQTFFNNCKEEYPEVTKNGLLTLKVIGKQSWGTKVYKLKTIKEEIKKAFDDATNALSIIENLPNAARVLKIYKNNGFNLAEAQNAAIIEENEEKITQARIDARKEAKGLVAVTEEKIQEVKQEVIAEVKEQKEETVVEEEEIIRVRFEMIGTKPNIMEVIDFMREKNNEGKIKVREIKEKGEK